METKKIRHTFKDCGGDSLTCDFDIISAKGLSKQEVWALIGQGYNVIYKSDWEDDMARVEKEVALLCGIAFGEKFLVKFS